MSEDEERAARQARLSKALSAAYLTHQITQLEDKVTHSHISNNPHRGSYHGGAAASSGPGGRGGSGFSFATPGSIRPGGQPRQLFDDGLPPPAIRGRGRGGGGGAPGFRGRGGGCPPGRGGPLAARGRGRGGGGGRGRGGGLDNIARDALPSTQTGLILPPMVESNVFPFHRPQGHGGFQSPMGGGRGDFGGEGEHYEQHGQGHHGRDDRNRREPERFVVDASALLWAPGGIKGMLKCGGEVIVPLECIRTLDILKKGMSPAAIAARAATRFIEEAQRKTRAHAPSSTEEDVIVAGVKGIGKALRPGMWIQSDEEVVDIFKAVADDEAANGEKQPPAPPYITATLQCALFYRAQWEVPSSTKILAIAHPSPVSTDPRDDAEDDGNVRKYRQRGDGYELEEWAEKADVGCKVLDLHKRGKGWGRGHRRKCDTGEEEDGLEAGAEALPDDGDQRRESHSGHGRSEGRHRRRSETSPSGLAPPNREIRGLDEARIPSPPTALLPKVVPESGRPRPRDDFTSPLARPVQLTAAALEQSQMAISQLEPRFYPRLERPPDPAVDRAVVSHTDRKDSESLRRDDAPDERRNVPRGPGRIPYNARNHAAQRNVNRRPDSPAAPVLEQAQPKMTLLQRPKG